MYQEDTAAGPRKIDVLITGMGEGALIRLLKCLWWHHLRCVAAWHCQPAGAIAAGPDLALSLAVLGYEQP